MAIERRTTLEISQNASKLLLLVLILYVSSTQQEIMCVPMLQKLVKKHTQNTFLENLFIRIVYYLSNKFKRVRRFFYFNS